MKINFKKQIKVDTFYTVVPLNWLLRIFYLSSIYRKGNKLIVSWTVLKSCIYIIFFGFINFYFLVLKIERLDGFRKTVVVKYTDSLQMTYLIGYFIYVIDLFHVYKFGRRHHLKYYEVFDRVDKILGMTYYKRIRRINFTIVLVFTIFFALSSIFDFYSWIYGFGIIMPVLYALDYLNLYLNMLTVFDCMSHVVQLEYRLKMIRDLIQDYYNYSNGIESSCGDQTMAIETVAANPLHSLRSLCHGRFIETIEFSRCYLLLLEQMMYINTMFGTRILLYYINALINTINLSNLVIRLAIGSLVTPFGSNLIPTIASSIRFINWAIVAITLVYRCEQSYRQSDGILDIIDQVLINKNNNSSNMRKTLTELRNLLITRPIRFHAAFFFTIDYTLLVSLTSVEVTYSIILLQNVQ